MTDKKTKGYKVISVPHSCTMPNVWYPHGTVIECEECGQQWRKSVFAFFNDGWTKIDSLEKYTAMGAIQEPTLKEVPMGEGRPSIAAHIAANRAMAVKYTRETPYAEELCPECEYTACRCDDFPDDADGSKGPPK